MTKLSTEPEPDAAPPPARSRRSRGRPAPAREAEASERLHAQIARKRDADAKARRETAVLERLVAESVSSEPLSVTWYDHPGVLTREQVLAFGVPRNATALHALMDRHRARTARDGDRRRR